MKEKTNNRKYPTKVGGKNLHAYKCWQGMHKRVNNPKCQYYHMYGGRGVTICDEWYEYSNFYEWFTPRFRDGDTLDKDILFKGNKVYSPSTCCLVPNYINCLITNMSESGCNKIDNGYVVRCQDYFSGERQYLGYFKTIEEGTAVYKEYKNYVIEKTATLALECGDIGWDVYDGLMLFKYELN